MTSGLEYCLSDKGDGVAKANPANGSKHKAGVAQTLPLLSEHGPQFVCGGILPWLRRAVLGPSSSRRLAVLTRPQTSQSPG